MSNVPADKQLAAAMDLESLWEDLTEAAKALNETVVAHGGRLRASVRVSYAKGRKPIIAHQVGMALDSKTYPKYQGNKR